MDSQWNDGTKKVVLDWESGVRFNGRAHWTVIVSHRLGHNRKKIGCWTDDGETYHLSEYPKTTFDDRYSPPPETKD